MSAHNGRGVPCSVHVERRARVSQRQRRFIYDTTGTQRAI
jgi:hypothetical protein